MLLSGNVNQNKGTQEGPTKIAKRYDMMVAISTNIWFYAWDSGQTKGAAVCLHSAQVTRRDGTWVTVLLLSTESVCERVAQKINQKHPPARLERKKCISSGYMRDKARLRKTVEVTFLTWPAFCYFFILFYMVWQPRGGSNILRINQVSSYEEKIQLVFILLYWYAENRLKADLTVNKETECEVEYIK